MSSDVEPWVRNYCRHWGSQKRRIWRGADWHEKIWMTVEGIDGRRFWHIDGYAESFMGKLQDEKMGATQGRRRYQHWPEVMWGEGLEVQRALTGMPLTPFDCLHLHYVFDPEWGLTGRKKSALLNLAESAYWKALDRAEFWIMARLISPNPSAQNQVAEVKTETSREDLKTPAKAATNQAQVIALRKVSLDFAPLQRSTVTLGK